MASVPLASARQMVAERLSAGDASGALALAGRVAAEFPKDRRVSALVGQAHLASGNADVARPELERAAKAFREAAE